MPPLYPKMRERPEEFRINYDAPLAEGLVFAGLGGHGCVGSMVYPDSSLYANHGKLTNMDAATDWVWSPELQRWMREHVESIPSQHVALTWTIDLGTLHTIAGWLNGYYDGNICGSPYDAVGASSVWVDSRSGTCTYAAQGWNVTYSELTYPTGWTHLAVTRIPNKVELFLNGKSYGAKDMTGTARVFKLVNLGAATLNNWRDWNGGLGDECAWTRVLSASEISALADPSNVDLRVSGVPLILPPRRRFWPVVSEQAIPKMVPWHLFQHIGV